ncbi:MAG: hypothetical protein OXG56_05940 [Gammaproteobacteria bacterium]|nr:hypothetical protein [Gammaproteobacteria bacterium]
MKSVIKTMLILMACWPFLSSGSGSGGGGDGETGFSANYALGKKVFQRKIICETCPYPGLSIPDGVAEIVPDLEKEGAIGKSLSGRERRSVKLFLKKQFGIES